ncbi:hypothetical protein Tco_0731115 [Tanacetum coccineum]
MAAMVTRGLELLDSIRTSLGESKKFRGGFGQDIDEQDKKKKRGGEDDEESKICCGLNNGGDEERWKSMALSEKGARSGLSKQRNASLKL